MAKTTDDLVEKVLQLLLVTDPLEQISTEDNSAVTSQYTTSLEDLRDQGLVYWTASAIPEAIFDALARYVAFQIAPAYGVSLPVDFKQSALARLRQHNAKNTVKQPVKSCYF